MRHPDRYTSKGLALVDSLPQPIALVDAHREGVKYHALETNLGGHPLAYPGCHAQRTRVPGCWGASASRALLKSNQPVQSSDPSWSRHYRGDPDVKFRRCMRWPSG